MRLDGLVLIFKRVSFSFCQTSTQSTSNPSKGRLGGLSFPLVVTFTTMITLTKTILLLELLCMTVKFGLLFNLILTQIFLQRNEKKKEKENYFFSWNGKKYWLNTNFIFKINPTYQKNIKNPDLFIYWMYKIFFLKIT